MFLFVEDDEDRADLVEGLVMKLVLINTKSLQECTIKFKPIMQSLAADPNKTPTNLSESRDSDISKHS